MVKKIMKHFNGLYCIHLELTSRCNKSCFMCGRRKIERDYPDLVNWGDMDFELVKKIANQIPEGIMVQLHNNGEPLMYPRLGEAIKLFDKQFTQFNTNAKLLLFRRNLIIDNLDSLCISVIENDPEGDEQFEEVKKFLYHKRNNKPIIVFRLLGGIKNEQRWLDLAREYNCIIARRTVHNPMGSFKYRRTPTIPEVGACLELFTHMAINRHGQVSLCVRFDPTGLGVIGDINIQSLKEIWNGKKRQKVLELHKQNKRTKVPFCRKCEFWGIPTSS